MVEVCFKVNGVDDYFTIKGETKEDIREKVGVEMAKRGLEQEKNEMFSREVSEESNEVILNRMRKS